MRDYENTSRALFWGGFTFANAAALITDCATYVFPANPVMQMGARAGLVIGMGCSYALMKKSAEQPQL